MQDYFIKIFTGELFVGWGLLVPHGPTSYENRGVPLPESEVMESCASLPFIKDDMGRKRATPISGSVFRWDLRRAQEKRDSIREGLSFHGSPPEETVAEQNEAVSEGKH